MSNLPSPMNAFENNLGHYIAEYEKPKRVALSRRLPFLKKPIIFVRHTIRGIQNTLDKRISYSRSDNFYTSVLARHQSLLRRKLGDSNPRLQEQKIINLKQALKKLNGVIIKPGDIFSLWQIVGKPTYENGFVDGMLLSNGKVVEGLGGGLCQLANFLYWIFLHTPIQTLERYHHSMDVFPDSGRTLPFGSGATILYNFIDLKVKNVSSQPLQLKIWLTETHLKGQILSPKSIPEKFHLFEKNHYFLKRGKKYFRYNEIYREKKREGKIVETELITRNFAPTLYEVTENYLLENHFKVLDFTNKILTQT